MKLKDGLKGIPVVKQYIYLVLFLFILNCSLNPNSKFWTEEKKIFVDKSSAPVQLTNKKKSLNEFNQNFKISIPKNLKAKNNSQLNNDGFIDLYKSQIATISGCDGYSFPVKNERKGYQKPRKIQ